MLTPIRLVILAAIAGIAIAIIVSLRTPPAPPDVAPAAAGTTSRPSTQPAYAVGQKVVKPDGLTIIEVAQGKGPAAQDGDTVSVHYTGTLQSNGSKFDSSRDRGAPIQFPLGQHQVIAGWDEGIAGMQVGEKRQLVIPSSLGYGPNGSPPKIPPDATLLFDVELVGIQPQ